jgi:hypothetical protein
MAPSDRIDSLKNEAHNAQNMSDSASPLSFLQAAASGTTLAGL